MHWHLPQFATSVATAVAADWAGRLCPSEAALLSPLSSSRSQTQMFPFYILMAVLKRGFTPINCRNSCNSCILSSHTRAARCNGHYSRWTLPSRSQSYLPRGHEDQNERLHTSGATRCLNAPSMWRQMTTIINLDILKIDTDAIKKE